MKTVERMELVDHDGEHTNSQACPLGRVTVSKKRRLKVPASRGSTVSSHAID